VALSLGSPPVVVSHHPVLWSPDFPPPRSPPATVAQPSVIALPLYRRLLNVPMSIPYPGRYRIRLQVKQVAMPLPRICETCSGRTFMKQPWQMSLSTAAVAASLLVSRTRW
jgi:hypothetical protein